MDARLHKKIQDLILQFLNHIQQERRINAFSYTIMFAAPSRFRLNLPNIDYPYTKTANSFGLIIYKKVRNLDGSITLYGRIKPYAKLKNTEK